MTNDVDKLRELDPVDRDQLAQSPVPREPLERILGEAAPVQRRRPRTSRALVSAAVVLGGAVAITGVIATLPGEDKSQTRALTSGLLAAAAAADEQSTTQRPTDSYSYSRMETTSLATQATQPVFSLLIRKVEERWVAADGTGRLEVTPKSPEFPSTRDEQRWIDSGRPLGKPSKSTRSFDAAEMARSVDPALPRTDELPDEPAALESTLRAAASGSDAPVNARMFELIGVLLAQPSISAELRAALFVVASRIDGIENLGATQDPVGRPGEAVALPSTYSGSRTRDILFFDPNRARFLASRTELLEPVPYTGGSLVSSRVLIATGVTDSSSGRP
jgi:hypothetical protein